jgi:transposase
MQLKKEDLMKLEKEEVIDLLLGIIAQLSAEIAELKSRLNQNSSNSSKPPSSDGFKKPKPKSLRQPSGKPVGGQVGHEGSGLILPQAPEKTEVHTPSECASCPKQAECTAKKVIAETRYEIDIQIEPLTTAHQTVVIYCPMSQSVLTGSFPGHVTGTLQYGINIKSLAVVLNTTGMLSINRTHEVLSGAFGIPISTGTVSEMVSDCAVKAAPIVADIKEAVKISPLIHSDETGVDVDKKTAWAHVASTDKLTYIDVQEKRGKIGINAIGILTLFMGTVIHDCFSPYFSYLFRHGLCIAHLLRELIGVLDNTGQTWAQSMIDLLLAMKKTKEELISQGIKEASTDYIQKYSLTFDEIMTEALIKNPMPIRVQGQRGRLKRGKTGALVDRLILHKDKYILFFCDFSVPFDNNQAERDIRMFKVKLKVSGCFRTLKGAREFAVISSYVSTARKHGIHAFKAIKDVLALNNDMTSAFIMTE